MGYKTLAIGVSDFAETIETGSYYVDKTLMIRELRERMRRACETVRYVRRIYENIEEVLR